MAEVKILIRKRSSVKSKMTIFKNYVHLIHGSSGLTQLQQLDLEERFGKFECLYAEFDALQTEIEALVDSECDGAFEEREEFETQYFELVALARSMLGTTTRRSGSVSSSEDKSGAHKHNFVRLPKINLPHFDGSYQYWLEFRDTFVSLIQSNNSIDSINKFHYLRASLQGTAALIIKNIDFKGDNYKIAWDLLCERFDNNRLLINNHIQALFDLESISTESSLALRNIVDVINKNIRALTTLNQPTSYWDTLLIFIMVKKLDITASRSWEEYRGNLKEDPTLSQFCTFLSKRADLLESIESNHNISTNNTVVALNNSHNSHNNKIKQNHNNKTFNNNNFRSHNCPLCLSPNHSLFTCESFRKLSIENRIEKAKSLKVCLNCLRSGHISKYCKLTHCKYCKYRHNTLLHLESNNPEQSTINPLPSTSDNVTLCANSMQLATSAQILLSTAMVNVVSSSGKKYTARLLLDNGSTANFVTKSLFEKLGLSQRGTSTKVTGINNHVSTSTQSCNLTIGSLCCAYVTDIECHILPEITKLLPSSVVNISHVPIPPGLKLADPNFNIPSVVDILVGAEIFWNVLGPSVINLGRNLPTLCETKFGWLVSGCVSTNKSKSSSQVCNFTNTSPDLSRFWELDNVPVHHSFSLEEKSCENHFHQTTHRNEDGSFVVTMPLKKDPSILGYSYNSAKNRLLSLERRFQRDPLFKDRYLKFMREYEDLGHMTKKTDPINVSDDSKINYFIPHHGVIRESSTTTKLRVVFDASAPTSSGASLNDLQMIGPVVQDNLLSIIIRFRQHRYVISGDIEKMYRAIELNKKQRHLQNILFRYDTKDPLSVYTLNTVTYGTASAPYLATKCLTSLANESQDERVKFAILHDFYVDDYLSGGNTIKDTIEVAKQVNYILSSANFNLRKWQSNSPEILAQISNAPESLNNNMLDFSQQGQANNQCKTLGLHWICNTDTLTYTINIEKPNNTKITKRHILSVISQIFDPLGLVGPCIVEAKLIMQQLWIENYDWDQVVSEKIKLNWLAFENSLPSLNTLSIPRWISCVCPVNVEIHVFTDASEKAYGACVYVRSCDASGTVHVQLLASKNRIAPIKPTTIPRLELCGALLGARLCAKVLESLTMHINSCRFWCDSTIVLSWLSAPTTQLQPFVRNRVHEIQESTYGHTWSYVPSKDNPADLVSRGIRADLIDNALLWWSGPTFLLRSENDWPKMPNNVKQDQTEVVALISDNHSSGCVTLNNHLVVQSLFENYSSFTKLQRVVAYLQRYLHNLKNKNNKLCGNLSLNELKKSLNYILHCAQLQMFPQEFSTLKNNEQLPRKNRLLSLSPFMDADNLIRVGGRLNNSPYDYHIKHPIIICSTHNLCKLLFQMQHKKLFHAGPQLLLATVRQSYWPLKGKNLAKAVVHKCVTCFRHKAQNVQPIMGQLPISRTQLEFPFQNSYVDYAGPVLIADRRGRGCKLTKSYLCIFVCAATKAVHLELVTDLTSEAYIAALNRFVSRRGKPRSITSDNGTNFVGASNELQRFLCRSDVASEIAQEGIEFHFVPAYSPHFNSLAEAAVKSCKHHLKRILHSVHFTYEEMTTCLHQIEAILNSRPLTPVSSDPHDFSALTPAHFLIGRPLLSVPQPQVTAINISRLDRWRRTQHIKQHFWRRFYNEYISLLQKKAKWLTSTGEVVKGSLVLVKERTAPPLLWCLGRVTNVYPGVDGVTRVAEIKTKRGTIRRAFNSICPLPIS